MKKFFDLQNPFWQMMGTLSDFIILSLLWLVFSLPIITVGPATTALISVGFHINRKSGNGVIREFVTAFRQKFRTSFAIGLIILILNIIVITDVLYYHAVDLKLATFFLFVFIFMGIIFAAYQMYLFPLLAEFDGGIKKTMVAAFLMMIRYLKWTIFLLTVTAAIIFFVSYIAPYLVLFAIGGVATLHAKVIGMLLEDEKELLLDDRH